MIECIFRTLLVVRITLDEACVIMIALERWRLREYLSFSPVWYNKQLAQRQ